MCAAHVAFGFSTSLFLIGNSAENYFLQFGLCPWRESPCLRQRPGASWSAPAQGLRLAGARVSGNVRHSLHKLRCSSCTQSLGRLSQGMQLGGNLSLGDRTEVSVNDRCYFCYKTKFNGFLKFAGSAPDFQIHKLIFHLYFYPFLAAWYFECLKS